MRVNLIISLLFFLLWGEVSIAQADFTSDVTEGCVPLSVRFAIDTTGGFDRSTVSSALWDFGNGATLSSGGFDTVTAVFLEPNDRFTVRLTINNDAVNSVARSGYINTYDSINSIFDTEKLRDTSGFTYSFTPQQQITKTNATYTFDWEFFDADDNTLYNQDLDSADHTTADLSYRFSFPESDTGYYDVFLTLTEINPTYNCVSITKRSLLVKPEFIVANVFSPSNPRTPFFIVNPENPAIVLKFRIFTRTGMQIFEQEAPIIHWDGRSNFGQIMNTGVYYYLVEATSGDDVGEYSKSGFIHLFR